MRVVHFVVPEDLSTPTGGNIYDLRVAAGLESLGWTVHLVAPGGVPDGALVLVDGLVAPAFDWRRHKAVLLLHMPPDFPLDGAHAVVTTSEWCREQLRGVDRVHVATPGVDPAELSRGSACWGSLLCVGVVARHKGHDLLVQALAKLADLEWDCMCIGALNREPEFVERLVRQAREHGMAERITFAGPRTGRDLDAAYAGADLLVLASRGESYGMAVTEALARGIPVLGTDAQGLPEALGRTARGELPGILVPPDDAGALAEALRGWLSRPELRDRLRQAARHRRAELTGWERTSMAIAEVLQGAGVLEDHA